LDRTITREDVVLNFRGEQLVAAGVYEAERKFLDPEATTVV
jgi:hypothetical protein